MLEKIKSSVKNLLSCKEIPGDPIDLTPGIKIKKTIGGENQYSFNEISENIWKERNAIKEY
jgi:hypothetical protein